MTELLSVGCFDRNKRALVCIVTLQEETVAVYREVFASRFAFELVEHLVNTSKINVTRSCFGIGCVFGERELSALVYKTITIIDCLVVLVFREMLCFYVAGGVYHKRDWGLFMVRSYVIVVILHIVVHNRSCFEAEESFVHSTQVLIRRCVAIKRCCLRLNNIAYRLQKSTLFSSIKYAYKVTIWCNRKTT